jgi:hypothetical protein
MFGIPWTTFVLGWAPMLLVAAGAFYLGLRAIRALERGRAAGSNDELLQQRINALEEAQLRAAEEIQHLRAQHEFTAKLLEQRRAPTDAV